MIVGAASGYDPATSVGDVSASWLQQLTAQVSSAKADLILIGMGFPLQENVARHLSTELTHGVFIGEGGSFDYESFGGNRPKAPARLQKLGLEWLWRLAKEPKRVRRQLAIPHFIYLVWKFRR